MHRNRNKATNKIVPAQPSMDEKTSNLVTLSSGAVVKVVQSAPVAVATMLSRPSSFDLPPFPSNGCVTTSGEIAVIAYHNSN